MTAPSPVRFDQEAAEEAAHQLMVTAESIIEALSVLQADIEVVTDDWQGHFRNAFDHEMGQNLTAGAYLAGTLQQMAAVVRGRAWEAAAAQAAYEEHQDSEDDDEGGG